MMYKLQRATQSDFDAVVASHSARHPLCGVLVGYPLIYAPDGRVWPEPQRGVTVMMDEAGEMFIVERVAS